MSSEYNEMLFEGIYENNMYKFIMALENGADVNAFSTKIELRFGARVAPLYIACHMDKMTMIKILIENCEKLKLDIGATQDALLGSGFNVLMSMCCSGSNKLPIVKMLVENRKHLKLKLDAIYEDGRTALIFAICNSVGIAEWLLENYPDELDINKKSKHGSTALKEAKARELKKCVKLLKALGAKE
jgi:hypothetical protein